MGEQLSQLLRDAIQERVEDEDTEETDEDDVIGTMAFGSGVEEDTIRNIVNGDIECPPPSRVPALAEEIPVTQDEIEDALAEDGCEEFQDEMSYKYLAKKHDPTL